MHYNLVVRLTGATVMALREADTTREWWLDFCLSSQHTESMLAEALSRPCSALTKATSLMSEVRLN